MARKARVALPEDDYLVLIGQVAYMVSSLGWTILGDLPGLARYLPADLNTPVLAGKTTGQIGGALGKAVDKIGDDDVRAYVELAGQLLCEASELRNDLLHARPATVGGSQRLYRWKMAEQAGAAPLDRHRHRLAGSRDRQAIGGGGCSQRHQADSQECGLRLDRHVARASGIDGKR